MKMFGKTMRFRCIDKEIDVPLEVVKTWSIYQLYEETNRDEDIVDLDYSSDLVKELCIRNLSIDLGAKYLNIDIKLFRLADFVGDDIVYQSGVDSLKYNFIEPTEPFIENAISQAIDKHIKPFKQNYSKYHFEENKLFYNIISSKSIHKDKAFLVFFSEQPEYISELYELDMEQKYVPTKQLEHNIARDYLYYMIDAFFRLGLDKMMLQKLENKKIKILEELYEPHLSEKVLNLPWYDRVYSFVNLVLYKKDQKFVIVRYHDGQDYRVTVSKYNGASIPIMIYPNNEERFIDWEELFKLEIN